jgi:hypothetical protein
MGRSQKNQDMFDKAFKNTTFDLIQDQLMHTDPFIYSAITFLPAGHSCGVSLYTTPMG